MGKNRINPIVKLAQKRTTFGWIYLILAGILGNGEKWMIFAGFIISLSGEFFRTMSAGTIKKNEVLAINGLYSLNRHPLYFGSFLMSLGISIASNNIAVWLYFLILFPLIYIPTMFKEEKYLKTKFGNDYKYYKKTIPAFFPKIKKINSLNFSWKRFKYNKEQFNWIAIVILYFILYSKKFFDFWF